MVVQCRASVVSTGCRAVQTRSEEEDDAVAFVSDGLEWRFGARYLSFPPPFSFLLLLAWRG